MRNINFENQQKNRLPKLGIITSIEELSTHDFIYIKNKIKSGDEINFVEDASRFWDKQAIAVYFKGYKLGYLSSGIRSMLKRAFLNKSYSRGIIQFNAKTKAICFNEVDLFIEIH